MTAMVCFLPPGQSSHSRCDYEYSGLKFSLSNLFYSTPRPLATRKYHSWMVGFHVPSWKKSSWKRENQSRSRSVIFFLGGSYVISISCAKQTTVYPVPELNKDFIASKNFDFLTELTKKNSPITFIFVAYEEVQKASASPPSDVAKGVVILDARLPDDFAGSDDDPKTGHIPHAFSLPFRMLVKSPEGYPSLIESEDFIGRLMKTLGPQADDVLSKKRPVITSQCISRMSGLLTRAERKILPFRRLFGRIDFCHYLARPPKHRD